MKPPTKEYTWASSWLLIHMYGRMAWHQREGRHWVLWRLDASVNLDARRMRQEWVGRENPLSGTGKESRVWRLQRGEQEEK